MKQNQIYFIYKLITSQLLWSYLALVGFNEFGNTMAVTVVVTQNPTHSSKATATATATNAPYVRKSREISATSSPEPVGSSQEQFASYKYPSFQHKYQTRMARFHDGSGPATRTYSIRSLTSFPKLSPLASIMSVKSGEVNRHPPMENNPLENDEQDPTFTPFISARALSNIPQFFQALRDNLEALQLDNEDEEHDDEEPEGIYGDENDWRIPNIPRIQEKPMRWMPVTAGMSGRSHVRHFIAANPVEQDLFYKKPFINPARNVYEFGLG